MRMSTRNKDHLAESDLQASNDALLPNLIDMHALRKSGARAPARPPLHTHSDQSLIDRLLHDGPRAAVLLV